MIRALLIFLAGLLIYGLIISITTDPSHYKNYPSKVDFKKLESQQSKSKPEDDNLRPYFQKKINDFFDLKKKNKNKTDKTIVQNHPNSDRSQCTKPPTVEQKVVTEFAGYILEYPCTVNSSGFVRTYPEEKDHPKFIYKLYLSVVFNEDGSIWKQEYKKIEPEKFATRVILYATGEKMKIPSRVKQIPQMDNVENKKINGLTFYRNSNTIVGFLFDEKDASGHPPAISCSASDERAIEDVFSLVKSPDFFNTYCSAGWALTEDIYIYMSNMTIKSKDAYHFREIYQTINSGIRDAIVSSPPQQ